MDCLIVFGLFFTDPNNFPALNELCVHEYIGLMVNVDEQAIECHKIATDGTRDTEVVKSEESLQVISALRHQPILKFGKQYAIIDGQTAYIYEDEQ